MKFDQAITIDNFDFHSFDPKNHSKGFDFLKSKLKNLNPGFHNLMIFGIDPIIVQYSSSDIAKSMPKAMLKSHPNYCSKDLITPIEFNSFPPFISASHSNDFSKSLLFPSRAFDFSANKSSSRFPVFAYVFSRRFILG